MTDKRFNDEEVSLILRRAMEADGGRGDTGLTLGQIKDIAAEVGIDPVKIESAALAVQAEGLGRPRGPLGLRATTRFEVEVEGEVGPERYADLIRVIRGALGRKGVATEEFGALEWKARDMFGGRYLTVRSEDGRTRVEGLGNFRDGAFVTGALGGTLGLAVTSIALKAAVGGVAFAGLLGPVALVAGATVPAIAAYRRWFRKEEDALRAAVAELSANVGADPEEPEETD